MAVAVGETAGRVYRATRASWTYGNSSRYERAIWRTPIAVMPLVVSVVNSTGFAGLVVIIGRLRLLVRDVLFAIATPGWSLLGRFMNVSYTAPSLAVSCQTLKPTQLSPFR